MTFRTRVEPKLRLVEQPQNLIARNFSQSARRQAATTAGHRALQTDESREKTGCRELSILHDAPSVFFTFSSVQQESHWHHPLVSHLFESFGLAIQATYYKSLTLADAKCSAVFWLSVPALLSLIRWPHCTLCVAVKTRPGKKADTSKFETNVIFGLADIFIGGRLGTHTYFAQVVNNGLENRTNCGHL